MSSLPHQTEVAVVTPSPTDSLPMLMLRLREVIMRRLRPLLRARDITEQQWRVLRVVGLAGVPDMQEVARLACIQPPSLSRIARKLVGRGLVQRLSAGMDQRRVQVRLTPEGFALVEALGPTLWQAYDEALHLMGRPRAEQATTLLAAMLATLPPGEADLPEDEED